jgi:hypothetical protein
MPKRIDQPKRNKVWMATKLAVRGYSRNPSDANAAEVRTACKMLRNLPVPEAATTKPGSGRRTDLPA